MLVWSLRVRRWLWQLQFVGLLVWQHTFPSRSIEPTVSRLAYRSVYKIMASILEPVERIDLVELDGLVSLMLLARYMGHLIFCIPSHPALHTRHF
jgi:hypothetical protein